MCGWDIDTDCVGGWNMETDCVGVWDMETVCGWDIQSRSLITKSDIANSGYNEAQKLVPAKILLYMNRNASVIANSGYNEISVIANWFCYPQWTIMPLLTNRPLISNHMFGPCEKFKPAITKWLPSVREPFLQNNDW